MALRPRVSAELVDEDIYDIHIHIYIYYVYIHDHLYSYIVGVALLCTVSSSLHALALRVDPVVESDASGIRVVRVSKVGDMI